MRTNNKIILDGTTMGGTTAVDSSIISLESVYCYSIQIVAAGATASGSVQMKVSNDQGVDELGTGVTHWALLDSATSVSALGTTMVNKDGVGYRWLKVTYTPASGSGTLTLTINTKGS